MLRRLIAAVVLGRLRPNPATTPLFAAQSTFNRLKTSPHNCDSVVSIGSIVKGQRLRIGIVDVLQKIMSRASPSQNRGSPLVAQVGESIEADREESLAKLRRAYADAQKSRGNKWLTHMSTCHIYLYKGGGEPSNNIAAFDLDGTIIKPKSNKRIPRGATDWQFFSVWTKVKLQQVIRENEARFVMFTNQNGVGLQIVDLEEIQERIELVTKKLDIPCTVFVATHKDVFRKPQTGMYELFADSFNELQPVNLEKSLYCGDAIGYPSHSDADIKFAQTLGLPFLTPEKLLRGVKPKIVPKPEASTSKEELVENK